MAGTLDVLVIGGGVNSVCCAYYLAEQGHSPVLVERDQVCSVGGSTYGNAGMIVPSDVVPLAAPGVLERGMRWRFDASPPTFGKRTQCLQLAIADTQWHSRRRLHT